MNNMGSINYEKGKAGKDDTIPLMRYVFKKHSVVPQWVQSTINTNLYFGVDVEVYAFADLVEVYPLMPLKEDKNIIKEVIVIKKWASHVEKGSTLIFQHPKGK